MNYRPDIDGLRAVAIILVLVYHGGLSLFPSGFVGVDVFFVISGFLITGIITEALYTDSFSFLAFYNRRLWRLQPALIGLILSTLFIAGLFFLPKDFIELSRSARKTILFMSNVFFNKTTTGYFSPDNHQLPLLHTWSLSIEWQCYLILPCIMYAIYRTFNRKHGIFATYFLMGMSLLISLYYSKNLPDQTYYQFTSRFFEFLVGACCALTPLSQRMNTVFMNSIAACSLGIIFYCAHMVNVLIAYPNGYALIVCVATGFLLMLGRYYPSNAIVALLSWRPVVFIGLLSYSLYLWHWLIFSILRYQTVSETPVVLFMAYVLTFILGYLSWRFIEKPSRSLKKVPWANSALYLVVVPILLIHGLDKIIILNRGFPQRFDQELVRVYQQLDHYTAANRPLCISNTTIDSEHVCTIGAPINAGKKALMIGDSFSNHYWGFIDVLAKEANVHVMAQGTSSCITLPGLYLYDWWHFKNAIYQECRDQTERYYRMIRDNHYNYVIVGHIWSNYLSKSIIQHVNDVQSLELAKKRLEIALKKALKIIIQSGAKPVLIQSSALAGKNLHDCFFQHIKYRQTYNPKACNFPLQISSKDAWFNALFARMQSKYPELIIIDPKTIQCTNNRCHAAINGVPIYRDLGHITDYASYQWGKKYLQKNKNPFVL